MSITNIVILITILLVVSIIGSIIFTKKEQAAALKRQQIANYRFKADEAQDLYDGLQTAGLEKIVYHFLLGRVYGNLKAAYEINPKTPGIKIRMDSAKTTIDDLANMSFHVEMPSGMMELHGLVGRLNKLMKYMMLMFQRRILPEQSYQQLMPSVQKTLIRFDAEGHMKMGHQAANEGQAGTAKQSYLYAKEKLIEYGTEDAYVQAQLHKVDELINSLNLGESEGEQANTETQVPTDTTTSQDTLDDAQVVADNTQLTPEEIKSQEAIASQEELNKISDSDGGFAPKKKW